MEIGVGEAVPRIGQDVHGEIRRHPHPDQPEREPQAQEQRSDPERRRERRRVAGEHTEVVVTVGDRQRRSGDDDQERRLDGAADERRCREQQHAATVRAHELADARPVLPVIALAACLGRRSRSATVTRSHRVAP